ncbi:hypothetical protein [Pseudorhodoferax sp. Leaf274]|uniref:hypothetical protein n=1 Tax=Pseudorhodoferax sp. Leaf274 TaxID=1736318 RepID=UPI00070382B8|nr:hypothetical protein [Pseudorhodoferax sp. Leaf274]KQP49840.1 hypothetical protein ASF44_04510 [Pseudorhodoferax sp. Leaf274]
MVALARFDAEGQWDATWVCDGLVRQNLASIGVRFGRWPLRPLDLRAGHGRAVVQAVQAVYGEELKALGPDLFPLDHPAVERLAFEPGDVRWPARRAQLLREHRQRSAEVCFVLSGNGLFYLRSGTGFLALLCEAGEWVALPAGLARRFDAGDVAQFEALRLFGQPQGDVAEPTDAILPALPLYDEFVARLLEQVGEELSE